MDIFFLFLFSFQYPTVPSELGCKSIEYIIYGPSKAHKSNHVALGCLLILTVIKIWNRIHSSLQIIACLKGVMKSNNADAAAVALIMLSIDSIFEIQFIQAW